MALWIELLVALLIVYGAVVTLTMTWFSRRIRLTRLLRLREARNLVSRGLGQVGGVSEKEEGIGNG